MDDPLKRAAGEAARHVDGIRAQAVSGPARPVDLRRHLEAAYRFDAPRRADAVLDDVAGMLRRGTVHGTHPAAFGFFQPSPLRSSIAASTLVAAYNPNASTYAHGTAAIEMERHVLRFLATRLGLDTDHIAAHFTSGGQEANTEALVVGLAARFPGYRDDGVRALPASPVVYVSAEAHHSIDKAATVTGLGRGSVRRIAVDTDHRMDVQALGVAIAGDRARGRIPFLVVGTVGTTVAGAIDPLAAIAEVAVREGLFLHVDAAWAGIVALVPRLRATLLDGLARADAITWDAHKGLQVPLGAGMFFTRHPEAALAAFGTQSPYMPRSRGEEPDPYLVSHAWSRRASGVPLFVALAELGEPGFVTGIERTIELGARLRARLVGEGFRVVNRTPLPVVCFTHPRFDDDARSPGAIARVVHRRGRVFVAPTELDGRRVLRAGITSFRTEEADVDRLVDELRTALG